MNTPASPIVLIGFKHAGKSVIGKLLAEKLQLPFVDLDREIESAYEKRFHQAFNCRQIMQEKGEKFFRLLEAEILARLVDFKPSVISVGGGTPIHAENQRLLSTCILVHITAKRGTVYERILMSGLPAFFDPDADWLKSFNTLWDERKIIYQKIRDFSIANDSTPGDAVKKILEKLNLDTNERSFG